METIIGFVAGYLVGSREGKAGLERLKTSWNTIRSSPEVRKLAADAITMAEQVVRRAPVGGISGAVVRTLASRAGGTRQEPSRAARPQALPGRARSLSRRAPHPCPVRRGRGPPGAVQAPNMSLQLVSSRFPRAQPDKARAEPLRKS
jgi:hypothetical protein